MEVWGAIATLGVFAIGHLILGLVLVTRITTKLTVDVVNIKDLLTRFVALSESHNERVIRLEEQAHARDKASKEWHTKVEGKFNGLHERLDRMERRISERQ